VVAAAADSLPGVGTAAATSRAPDTSGGAAAGRMTGSAARPWPEPGCGCLGCSTALGGTAREPTGLRFGGLTVVRNGTVHPDGDPGAGRAPAPGEGLAIGGVRVAALPGPGGSTALVLSTAGRTVLWVPAAGPLPAPTLGALDGAGLDGVALSVGGTPSGTDLGLLAAGLAALREVDALAPGCDAVPIGLDHDLGDPSRASTRLASWGARLVADGDPWPLPDPARYPVARRTLVLGPASSGKSARAEDLLLAEPAVLYAATGPAPGPGDGEWAAKVAAHRARRPPHWATDEDGDLAALLRRPGPPLLVDSLGTWVAGVLDRSGAWDEDADDREVDTDVEARMDELVGAWRSAARRVVAVGEEVGWGVVPATASGRRFRDALGVLTRRLAGQSERVELVVAGVPLTLSGAAPGAGSSGV